MTAVLKASTGITVADVIYNDIVNKKSIYYYYFGKVLSWNPLGADNPETPHENYNYELSTRANIVTIKSISPADVSFVIRRIPWTTDTVFDMYDDSYSVDYPSATGATTLDDSNYYVVTEESNVYKCIENNNGAVSTVRPTGYDVNTITTSDGYIWKFMYNIPIGYKNKFYDSNYIPVTTSRRNQFYANGSLTSITVENTGSGYVDASTTITVDGDGYLAENPYDILTINLSSGGFGYSSTPSISITPPVTGLGSDIQATASLVKTGSSVSSVSMLVYGHGYDDSAIVTIAEPITTYSIWTYGQYYALNTKIKFGDNYYNVSTAGTSGYTPPIHISGDAVNGTAVFTYVASKAKAYLSFSKTNAIIDAIVSGGQVIDASIVNAGIGYTYCSLSVSGVGTGAKLSSDLSVGDLNTLQANVELLAANRGLSYIRVTNGGTGYSSATVVIEGDGTGATAIATMKDGSIDDIVLLTIGSGYTYANAYIVGSGVGAILRVIISPPGGHGSNAVLELGAKTLMFFSSLSSLRNQGIVISNDTRQVGILKSPNMFGLDQQFRNNIGSACYLLTLLSQVDTIKFLPDMKLNTGNKEYYIINISGNSLLVASLKNDIPVLGESMINASADSITPISITNPTIDKYSGTMLFIDNRNAFNTSAEQSLSLRTTIQF